MSRTDRITSITISLLGLSLVVVGTLAATVLWNNNLDNRIAGIIMSIVGFITIPLPWADLILRRRKKEETTQ